MLNATIIAFAFMKKVNSYLKESADRPVYKIDMKWISQTFILLKYTLPMHLLILVYVSTI